MEALEFTVTKPSQVTDKTLIELSLKPNQLICCITRGDKIIIPKGDDTIQVGDTVVVVTLDHELMDINDILAD